IANFDDADCISGTKPINHPSFTTFQNHFLMNRFLTLAAAAVLPLALAAVPAKRGKIMKLQPDGTEIPVEIIGDERAHVVLSEDGLLLMPDSEGRYCYATATATGDFAPSQVVASPAASRSAAESLFVASLARFSYDDAAEMAARLRSVAPARNLARAPKAAAKASGLNELATPGACSSTFPTQGEVRSLVILVSYSNLAITINNPREYFDNYWNKTGFSEDKATGSVRDYFISQSGGRFKPQFDVYGPVKLPNRQSYYGANDSWGQDRFAHEMAIHACELLDDEIDFSIYDSDKDGLVDNVYIIYAGLPESGAGGANTVWPHSFDISSTNNTLNTTFDGVTIDHYACSSEYSEMYVPAGIGTPCHEFSHVLGLPDLYSTDGRYNSETPYEWSVLDRGTYLNDARTPLGYSLFERYALGWAEPRVLDGPMDVTLREISTGDGAIVLTENPDEYFLFENRQKNGWDSYAPASGMLVWHIDYDRDAWDRNAVNNNSLHQRVDVEEADGKSWGYGNDLSGATFPGKSKSTTFTASTTPSMQTWEGIDLDMPITHIEETSDGLIKFKVKGGATSIVDAGTEAFDIRCEGLTLSIAVPGRMTAEVSDVSGRHAATLFVDGTASMLLPAAGIYIVRVGSKAVKVAAR
ncbi:MAG: M6 family metalloprotease domain-containing protein, partial [Paramuribaculum sp.]|nr:M6 family metalloprotease domain-containing protein [Paramuribaculum sp.]